MHDICHGHGWTDNDCGEKILGCEEKFHFIGKSEKYYAPMKKESSLVDSLLKSCLIS